MLRRLGKAKYRIALVVVLAILAFFLLRAFDNYRALVESALYGKADIHSIRGWMNVDRVSRLYNADPACICGQYNLSMPVCSMKSMWELEGGGRRRLPPDDRGLFLMMNPVFERITLCMYDKPKPDDWMRISFISRLYSVEQDCVCGRMGLSKEDCGSMLVIDLIRQRGPGQDATVKDEIWGAVQECPKAAGGA
jgi:hypothetical protein